MKKLVCFVVAAFSIVAGCQASLAAASAFEMKMFGHEVAIIRRDDGQILMIDGREVLKNEILDIRDALLVGGVPALVGSSSPGGNTCDAAPFVVSFPQGLNPRLDGPIESCRPVKADVGANEILFATVPIPNTDGETWKWTPSDGLIKSENRPFVPDASKGWATLREKSASHPSELIGFGEIAAQIDALLGADRNVFSDIITGVGSGSFDGDYFVGSACTRHLCQEEEALLVASISDKRVFLAWKPQGEKIVVRPLLKQWPERAKAALRDWAAKWK